MELLKLLSAPEIIAQIISFLVLLFILRIFAWKRILALLDQRKEKIAHELASALAGRLEAERLKTDYEAKLAGIESAAGEKIKEAINEGRKIAEEIKKKAEAQAREIIEGANDDIKQELLKVREGLKSHIIDLTLAAAENVIERKLTAEDEKKLIEDFLEDIDKPGLS